MIGQKHITRTVVDVHHRTLFSTPPKQPHLQRKKILADRYANTNVMRPDNLQALQGRAEAFLRNCLETKNGDPDVYVRMRLSAPVKSYLVLIEMLGSLALFRYGRGNALSVRAKGY